jgi:hypothetical protein
LTGQIHDYQGLPVAFGITALIGYDALVGATISITSEFWSAILFSFKDSLLRSNR